MTPKQRADAVRRMAKRVNEDRNPLQLSKWALSQTRQLPTDPRDVGMITSQNEEIYNDDIRNIRDVSNDALEHASAGRSKEAAEHHTHVAQACRSFADEVGEPHAEAFAAVAEAHEKAAEAHKRVK